jgi:DNA-binding MarR family transcriptional regulator
MITVDAVLRQQWDAARPDLDLSGMEIVGALKHACAMLDVLHEPVFEGAAITSSEFDLLVHLRHAPEPTIARRLAVALGRTPAALSKALAKLEARGLVVRQGSAADRRAVHVSITDAGAAAVDDVMPKRLALEASLLADLAPAERTKVADSLRLLSDLVEARARS